MQKIFGLFLKAVEEFSLIESGDKIAVGVSGGKDSVVLLECFIRFRKYINRDVDLIAITLDLNFGGESTDYSEIEDMCKLEGLRHIVELTKIADVVFKHREESNPCSLCSKLRKGILNTIAKENGCNKVSFGHHFDDVVETFIMNLFNEGRVGCFSPKTYLQKKNLTLIRPLVFVKESEIVKAVKKNNFCTVKSFCPVDGETNREKTKQFLKEMEKNSKGFKARLFGAIRRAGLKGWEFKN